MEYIYCVLVPSYIHVRLQSEEIRNRTATLCRAVDRIYEHSPLGVWITVSILRNRENRRTTRCHAKSLSLHVYIPMHTCTSVEMFDHSQIYRVGESVSTVINDREGIIAAFSKCIHELMGLYVWRQWWKIYT